MRLITQTDLTFKSNLQLQFMIREYLAMLQTMDASSYEYYIVRDSLTIMQGCGVHGKFGGTAFVGEPRLPVDAGSAQVWQGPDDVKGDDKHVGGMSGGQIGLSKNRSANNLPSINTDCVQHW